ncbi:Ni,Fe-hydrogenase III small subunit [Desulfonispora thiosulfatigenes DSM 11270]|uniref:Ni,Fe-hydrogenase III small subunit n=1 Tax=Desulfonispora thiosulfatigenes DSM 11270 TaxID=656914 RepID=A0A1W1VC08_DESTI|nr:NADH-quinone oxidoreductase subunit NuoB [Desulfonispora thiosulfatigenes]SMB90753.1 Ni,Fe-hydrogenase III small subunit [Desulfonispora thiosulfatigenes DSM 11270]
MRNLLDRLKNKTETVKNVLYENPHSYGELLIDEKKCTLCGKCQKSCLVKAIEIKNAKIVVNQDHCIYCRNCISTCPENALTMLNDCKLAHFNDLETSALELKKKIYQKFNRSLVLRSVDTGSCEACLLELAATQNTFYAASRFGIKVAASPRHSDGLVITGPVTLNMKDALLKTYDATAEPKMVIAMGSCAYDGGIFKDCYGNFESLNKILPVDLYIPGCPPSPQAVIHGLLKLMNRI